MTDRSRWWLLLPRPLRALPADLAATALLTVAACAAAVLPVVSETPVRAALGLPMVLFLPGYAFVAALFPEAGSGPAEGVEAGTGTPADSTSGASGIDGIERVALSFGLSIALVPLLGLVLNFTPWGIRLVPILVAVGGFTLVATGTAALRRWALPAGDRFRVPYRSWLADAHDELFRPDTGVDAALNVLLVVSVLLATGAVGYAVAVPKQGEAFTEFYLLTEGEEGELVAADYPTEFVRGESKPLVVGIGNHEHETVRYSVVVQIQRVTVADNETTVRERRQIGRFDTRLADNETAHERRQVAPTLVGEDLRLVFLLYRGAPPAAPTVENSYRETHLWVNVTRAG